VGYDEQIDSLPSVKSSLRYCASSSCSGSPVEHESETQGLPQQFPHIKIFDELTERVIVLGGVKFFPGYGGDGRDKEQERDWQHHDGWSLLWYRLLDLF